REIRGSSRDFLRTPRDIQGWCAISCQLRANCSASSILSFPNPAAESQKLSTTNCIVSLTIKKEPLLKRGPGYDSEWARTTDLMPVKHALSQLSYGIIFTYEIIDKYHYK